MESCPQGAISFKAGKFTLAGPVSGKNADPEDVIQKRRQYGRIVWGAALGVLLFSLLYFNWIEPAREAANSAKREESQLAPGETGPADETADVIMTEETESRENAAAETEYTEAAKETEESTEAAGETAAGEPVSAAEAISDAAVGTEVGNLLPDFRTELLGGGEFHLASCRGQVVIINLWATTCAPCIEELPGYEQLKVAHPEVEILAIHHRAGAKKAEDFLADKGWDHLDFALDSKEKGLYTLLDAADAMPQTIVLNTKGEIIYNAQAPLSYEQLEALFRQAS